MVVSNRAERRLRVAHRGIGLRVDTQGDTRRPARDRRRRCGGGPLRVEVPPDVPDVGRPPGTANHETVPTSARAATIPVPTMVRRLVCGRMAPSAAARWPPTTPRVSGVGGRWGPVGRRVSRADRRFPFPTREPWKCESGRKTQVASSDAATTSRQPTQTGGPGGIGPHGHAPGGGGPSVNGQAVAHADRTELHTDTRADRAGGLRHRVLPGALTGPTHDEEVASSERERVARPAAPSRAEVQPPGPPRDTTATRVSPVAPRPTVSPCQATLSRPSR